MNGFTHHSLPKRLIQYGALSATIAGISNANGQVYYVDHQDGGGQWVVIVLDMNGDGQGDFNIRHSSTFFSSYDYLGIWTGTQNAVLGNSISSYLQYPFALSEGAMISAGVATWMNGNRYQSMNWGSCNYPYSNWCNVTDRYLGLRFQIEGNTHYGWARLDVGQMATNWVLKDVAYNLTPDAPIMAGEGLPLGFDDNAFSKIKIVALNKSIALFNLPRTTNYKLYNMSGQSVIEGVIKNDTYTIEANSIASGIYIIELEDKNTKGIIRKKLVL